MGKIVWKPGTMLYPVPAVLVTSKCGNAENVLTISWVGTVCTDPPLISISVRPERHSYRLIRESNEFVVNLPGEALAHAVDYCGVKSGRDVDKFEMMRLTRGKAAAVSAPLIDECPVSLECRVKKILELGSHHMFIAEVAAVDVEENLLDKTGKLRLDRANLLCYNHGGYAKVSSPLGKFGFSVERKRKRKKRS
jgi:flavin reductase (DIM6/NTAB) family NADH-FMN oxidoreductase RutF